MGFKGAGNWSKGDIEVGERSNDVGSWSIMSINRIWTESICGIKGAGIGEDGLRIRSSNGLRFDGIGIIGMNSNDGVNKGGLGR